MNKTTLIIAGLCSLYVSCKTKTNEKNKDVFPVIQPVIRDTTYTREYVAEIKALENVEIRTRIKGYIETIHVDEGQVVRQGQLLFTISSRVFQQELQKAKALTKNAMAEHKSAEIELENAAKLLEKNVISLPQYELAKAKVEGMKAKVEQFQSEELQAEIHLSFSQIKAPFDGIINRIPYKKGSLLEEGTLLTTISNNNEILAYFNVSENDYLDYTLSPDKNELAQVKLLLANGSEFDHTGKIDAVESEFDDGNIAFRARFPNPNKLLKHGSNGKVVKTKKIPKAMMIPQKSTFEIQDKIFVYVLNKNQKLEQRNVVVQMRFPHIFVIEKGLKPDETILYEGLESVRAGDEIQGEWKNNVL
jgi:RND family efflux transporter MFP subunit